MPPRSFRYSTPDDIEQHGLTRPVHVSLGLLVRDYGLRTDCASFGCPNGRTQSWVCDLSFE
jgi:hypothetical protein